MKKFTRVFSLLVIAVLIFTCFCGCGDKSKDEIIYLTVTEKPKTLDPQTAETETELMLIRNFYEGLTRIDQSGSPVLSGAESYKKNGNTYTFKLRKDAKWSNGDTVTAYDYAFAFDRATDTATEAPFYDTLISNIAEITATDKYTVKVTAVNNNENEVLTFLSESILMPCNEKFFNSAMGKYGLSADTAISNGSYMLTKWNVEDDFAIRLKRYEDYTGNFTAKNAAVFVSMPEEDYTAYTTLSEGKSDIAFIESSDISNAEKDFNIISLENTCWFLTMSNDLNSNTRKAFKMLIDESVYKDNLNDCLKTATSMFPAVFGTDNATINNGMYGYDAEQGKLLMSNSLASYENKTLPKIKIYYPAESVAEPIVKDIAGHWQNKLGAYVNIEPVEHTEYLTEELTNQTYQMALVPVKDSGNNLINYLKNFGYTYNGQGLEQIQGEILKSGNIYPLLFEKTAIAYSKSLNKIKSTSANGYIDFSFVVKQA